MDESSVLDLRGKKLTDVCETQSKSLSDEKTKLLNVVTLDLSFNLLTQLTSLRAEVWPALRELRVGSNELSEGLEGLQR